MTTVITEPRTSIVAVGGGVPVTAQRNPLIPAIAGFSDAIVMYFCGSALAA